MTLGLKIGSYTGGLITNRDSALRSYPNEYAYGVSENTNITQPSSMPGYRSIGITTDPTKSGIIVELDTDIKLVIKY